MKFIPVLAVALAGLALSGCATIIEGTTQSISLATPPADGARCELKNSQGTWFVTTPGSVVVHKTRTNLTVSCKKEGYQEATTVIESKFNSVTAGNVIAGGLIGIGVDAASGANYGYPPLTEVPLVPLENLVTPAATEPDLAPPPPAPPPVTASAPPTT